MTRTRVRYLPGWLDSCRNWSAKTWYDYQPSQPLAPPNVIEGGPNAKPAWVGSLYYGWETTTDENHGQRDYSNDFRLLKSNRPNIEGMTVFQAVDSLYGNSADVGGTFRNEKYWIRINNPRVQNIDASAFVSGGNRRTVYRGPLLARTISSDLLPPVVSINLTTKGATAIARCKPTNNVADLAVDIAETFQQGFPKLLGHSAWKARTSVAKAAGSEYLNSEFGWKPLVSDIRDSAYGLANAHRLLSAYERNSGQVVRRRYEFPVETTSVTTDLGPVEGTWFSSFNTNHVIDLSLPQPHLYKTATTYRRTWFSGAFTYHLPTGYSSRNWLVRNYARAGPLLGIELTPNVVWNAMPWTWAANWASNLGDVVTNVSDWSTDGLVLKYGYIMDHFVAENIYTLVGPPRFKTHGKPMVSSITAHSEVKRREKASPFGFGVDWTTFTPRQLAITAALGLTRR